MADSSRNSIDFADFNDTCWSRMIWTRVGKPVGRRHSGGAPYVARIQASVLSRAANSCAAWTRVFVVKGANLCAFASLREPSMRKVRPPAKDDLNAIA